MQTHSSQLIHLKVTFPTPLLGGKKHLPKYHIAEVFDVFNQFHILCHFDSFCSLVNSKQALWGLIYQLWKDICDSILSSTSVAHYNWCLVRKTSWWQVSLLGLTLIECYITLFCCTRCLWRMWFSFFSKMKFWLEFWGQYFGDWSLSLSPPRSPPTPTYGSEPLVCWTQEYHCSDMLQPSRY